MKLRPFAAIGIAAIVIVAAWAPLRAQETQEMRSGDPSPESEEAIQRAALRASEASAGIAMSTFSFTATKDNTKYSPSILGESPFDPPQKFGNTTINVVIVPLVITIKANNTSTTFDPTAASSCIVGTGGQELSPMEALMGSPLFTNVTWDGSTAAGHGPLINGVNMGTTTYIDAFRRAEFWQLVGGTPYQTTFTATQGAPVTISAATITNLGGGTVSGSDCTNYQATITDASNFQNYLKNTVIPSISGLATSDFLYFVTEDVNITGANGYHNYTTIPGSSAPRVFVFAQYNTNPVNSKANNRPGTVTGSHELAEATDDPLTNNKTPKWSSTTTAQGGSCQGNWEVGDPLEGTTLAPIVGANGVTYYVQELGFLDWYYASGSTNSQGTGYLFSTNGTFQGPSFACPPGGYYTGQSITFQPISGGVYGTIQSAPLVATASSDLTVSFTSTTPDICAVSNNTATILGAGSCSIQATQSGNTVYAAAPPVTQTFNIAKADQTITFGPIANEPWNSPPITLTATASSGLPVSYSTGSITSCAVSGDTVQPLLPGGCKVEASQSGSGNYNAAAPVFESFTVELATQTITFGPIANQVFGAPPISVNATASSGLPVLIASQTTKVCTAILSRVTLLMAGTCTLQATQMGDTLYTPATPVSQSFTVAPANQTITFGALPNQTYGAPPFTVSATASSGLAVSFASLMRSVCTVSGATVTLVAGGTCTIQASQSGNADYNAAPVVNQSFIVAKEAQTISFAALPNRHLSAGPFTVSATATSGLGVSFTSATLKTCTVAGNVVNLITTGTCTIQASQQGNNQYLAAQNVSQSFKVLSN